MPVIGLDYCFLRNTAADGYISVLVGRDKATKAVFAHVVPCKGSETDLVCDQVCRDIRKLGHHGRVILKSDQEPAIVDFLQEVAKRRTGCVTIL